LSFRDDFSECWARRGKLLSESAIFKLVTTVTTLDRNTGKAASETLIGDSPYGK
jgi:hypothetical protein